MSMSWATFEQREAALADAGRQLLTGSDGVCIAFLATVSETGQPSMAPVCPVFSGADLYLIVTATTPKARHLAANGRYALHAFLGAADHEFQITGTATEVQEIAERNRVRSDINFAASGSDDPIFKLGIDAVFEASWQNVGQPDTQRSVRRWRSN